MSQNLKFARTKCAAFTWTAEGHCRGVLLERTSNGCRVSSQWSAESSQKASAIAEALSSGKKAIGVTEGDYCIAGSANGGWGMADVYLPKLKSQETMAALAFELRKRTPVSAEHLTWGYRLLPSTGSGDGKQPCRLFYVKTDIWRRWTEAASGLSHVDLIVPAPVLLDPLFSGADVVLPGKEPFVYVSTSSGRDVLPGTLTDAGGAARKLRELLPWDGLDIGVLGELPESQQQEYAQAIVLALYGMSRDVSRDVGTLPKVPSELQPRRFQACRYLAACLALFIGICLVVGLTQAVQQRVARLRLIRKDISAVETQIKSLQGRNYVNAKEAAKSLEAEITKYKFDAPGLPEVLIELTGLISPPAWLAGSFDWSMDAGGNVVPVSFTIREPMGDTSNMDLSSRLNESEILGDVAENKSMQTRTGALERKFVLKARYDTEEEKLQLQANRKEARRRAAEEAAAARNASESGKAEEEVSDDNGGEVDYENVQPEQTVQPPAPSAPPAPPAQ